MIFVNLSHSVLSTHYHGRPEHRNVKKCSACSQLPPNHSTGVSIGQD